VEGEGGKGDGRRNSAIVVGGCTHVNESDDVTLSVVTVYIRVYVLHSGSTIFSTIPAAILIPVLHLQHVGVYARKNIRLLLQSLKLLRMQKSAADTCIFYKSHSVAADTSSNVSQRCCVRLSDYSPRTNGIFWSRNSSHIATHLVAAVVIVFLLVSSNKPLSFQIGPG